MSVMLLVRIKSALNQRGKLFYVDFNGLDVSHIFNESMDSVMEYIFIFNVVEYSALIEGYFLKKYWEKC